LQLRLPLLQFLLRRIRYRTDIGASAVLTAHRNVLPVIFSQKERQKRTGNLVCHGMASMIFMDACRDGFKTDDIVSGGGTALFLMH
jgi:hypothetical protein